MKKYIVIISALASISTLGMDNSYNENTPLLRRQNADEKRSELLESMELIQKTSLQLVTRNLFRQMEQLEELASLRNTSPNPSQLTAGIALSCYVSALMENHKSDGNRVPNTPVTDHSQAKKLLFDTGMINDDGSLPQLLTQAFNFGLENPHIAQQKSNYLDDLLSSPDSSDEE